MVEEAAPGLPESGPAVVLGAGYAGLRLVQTVHQLARGKIPLVLVDRHPVHVLRTELYEVGRLARGPASVKRFALPLRRALDGAAVQYREGEVEAIDLDARTVRVSGTTIAFRSLAICLGNVAAYYRVPGAREHSHSVYRLGAAQKLAMALKELEHRSGDLPLDQRPVVLVVGGGSTGTEVAAEIATVPWHRVAGRGARPPAVTLVTGAIPLLAGLPEPLVRHARVLLARARVTLLEGLNVTEVGPDRLTLADGTVHPFDLCVWAAGLEAPEVVRGLSAPHGHGGRIKVEPTLEVPGHPGVFGVGDVIEFEDPRTGLLVPSTAQAALTEAAVAGANLVARWSNRALRPYVYRERGTIVSVGLGSASGVTRHLTIWGSPAKLLKRAVEREYSIATERGQRPLVSR